MTFLLLEIFGFIFVLLYLFYRYEYWNFPEKKEEIKEYGVYLLFFKPKNFIQFLQTILGYNLGGVKLLLFWKLDSADEYLIGSFNTRNGRYKIAGHYYNNKYDNYYSIKLPIKNLRIFYVDFYQLTNEKWSPIKSNCLTVYKKLLKGYGIEINTIFPSKFLKQYTTKPADGV